MVRMDRGMIEALMIWGGKQWLFLRCSRLWIAASLSDVPAGDSAVGVEAERGGGNREKS